MATVLHSTKKKSGFILVAINDGSAQLIENGIDSEKSFKAGNFYLIKAGDSLTIVNHDKMPANYALLEIK